MVHAELGFRLLKALLNGPAKTTEPHEDRQACASWSVTDKVGVGGIVPDGSTNDQPYRFLRQPAVGQYDSTLGELIDDRPFGPFGNLAAIPEVVVDVFGQRRYLNRLATGIGKHSFGAAFSPVGVVLFNGYRSLYPTKRVLFDCHKVVYARQRFDGFDELRTHAIHGVRKHIFKGEDLFCGNIAQHLHRQLGFTLEGNTVRELPEIISFISKPE